MKLIRNLKGVMSLAWLAMVLLAGYSLNWNRAEAAETIKFPIKPITILNSSSAGSPADVMARQVAQHARKFLGQPMVVVTKPGGSGGVMFASLMGDPADGYTIATVTGAFITSLHGDLKKDFSFDQFDFMANIQKEPYCIAVTADSPFKTLGDMVGHAKNQRLKMGGQGTASSMHLMALLLAEEAGIRISWVPFGGGSEIITNLLGNHVPVVGTSPSSVNQYVEAGKIRVLGVSGDQRMPHWKNVPTLKESGYNVVITQYRGFAAKKGMPPDVKAKLLDAIKKAAAEPGFKDYMAKNYQVDAFMGPEEFTAFARADHELMGKLMNKLPK
jgi:tripartite-type tricarboxylate transporter receptor subunit TctC